MSTCAPPSPRPSSTSVFGQDLRHAVDARVERLHGELDLADRLRASGRGTRRRRPRRARAAISATVVPSNCFSSGDCTSCTVMRAQLPNDAGLLQLFAELRCGTPGRRRPRACAAFDLSSNTRFQRRKGGEREGVAHVDLARQRQRRGLRPRAARDQRRGPAAAMSRTASGMSSRSNMRDERDRPAALGEHEVEQLELRLVQHADLLRHRDLDRALAAFLERVAVGLQLLAAGVAARQRPALVAEVLVQQRAREAEGAGIDRFAEQCRSARFPRRWPRAPSTPRPSRNGGTG